MEAYSKHVWFLHGFLPLSRPLAALARAWVSRLRSRVGLASPLESFGVTLELVRGFKLVKLVPNPAGFEPRIPCVPYSGLVS